MPAMPGFEQPSQTTFEWRTPRIKKKIIFNLFKFFNIYYNSYIINNIIQFTKSIYYNIAKSAKIVV